MQILPPPPLPRQPEVAVVIEPTETYDSLTYDNYYIRYNPLRNNKFVEDNNEFIKDRDKILRRCSSLPNLTDFSSDLIPAHRAKEELKQVKEGFNRVANDMLQTLPPLSESNKKLDV